MNSNLLLMAWPNEDEVLTQLMWSTGYNLPDPYAGEAEITQIASHINETHYELIYRCVGCLQWDHEGSTGGLSTSAGNLLLGWAHAYDSPENPSCPASVTPAQHDTQHIFPAVPDENAANPSYTEWAALATDTVEGDCEGGGDDEEPVTGQPVPTDTAYDYVVVGAGAAGITLADKLSEAGHSVLLIEKGEASTGRWGGELGPEWTDGTDLTRFDVPGLCNEIWHDSAGIACTDMDQMAGCILGGGTAVNAGLWWKPYSEDWDYNFPNGWKAGDMVGATERVFERIPGTEVPSMDGELYLQQGFDVVSSGLAGAGWEEVSANEVPDQKNRTFTHTPYMFSDGERGGPLATYLVSASERDNFDMWLGTGVKRVVREGSRVTGVEVEPMLDGGYNGTVQLADRGRVVLSGGTFGSAKVLLRSEYRPYFVCEETHADKTGGIGPADQLEIVKGSAKDGETMISEDQWIDLPVGYNLEDHTNVSPQRSLSL